MTHLILTHENADFDAVAAQHAAACLTPGATPILSRHVNRNVQEFLNLYGGAFRFVHPDHLERQRIEQATIVDSQAHPSVRGVKAETPLLIIDHHPLTRTLEPHQQFTGDLTGATTTLLVERMRAERFAPSPIEATLFMLGIYEDTGSLLYGTTTVRDVLAAAWLLERGADLDIVRKFMIHPLTDDQRMLYGKLLESAQAHQVHGFAILIATASVERPIDEISTLAHRLRDHFDPHAMCVLVGMPEYTQMVLRSMVDNIDVGAIAARFGGGGHSRAAAATVRDWPLHYIEAQLIEMLPDVVIPSALVAEIMSWGAQTIDADDTIETAAQRMQRSGHEGYPVLGDGEIAGLLQRRDVDRAMSHGLGQRKVETVMAGGRHTVRPGDSIELLQQIMMHSGWGQVPVVDDQGRVVGIVTRTDLIRRWGQEPLPSARQGEIQERMRRTLQPSVVRLLEAIAAEAEREAVAVYAVGGFVRDLLLGTSNLDLDFVVEGDAMTLARRLVARHGGSLRTHGQFGTAKWLLGGRAAADIGAEPGELPPHVDFATARTEFYEEPTALPTVEQRSIKLDLHRRDFTINTLAIRLSPAPFGQLLDFYGGERDLRDGLIRVLHSLSFVDDPTRVLRAARFEQRLDFHIEPRTENLIAVAFPYLKRLSADRLRHELDLILHEALPEKALIRLEGLGVLETIDEALHAGETLARDYETVRAWLVQPAWQHGPFALADVYWIILLARTQDQALHRIAERLKAARRTVAQAEQVQAFLARAAHINETTPPSAQARMLDGLSEEGLIAAWALAGDSLARSGVARYARTWRFIRPTINGQYLIARGLRRGPIYRTLLGRLRDAWLDGRIATTDQEQAVLEGWIAEAESSTDEERT